MTKTKHLQWSILAAIVFSSFFLMLNASLRESATMDELAHIPAGYGYVKYFDFRLNPEHPPLVKAIAAFPLLFQKLNFPLAQSSWRTDVNGQWASGAQFLYESGNDADKIVQLSRLGPMLLTLILTIFIYIWAKELMGSWWALFPAFLFSFSPNILSHGHFVTTDIGAALGIFIALYFFVKFIFNPSRNLLIAAGIAFGFAQLMKFSAVLLVPFFVFLMAVFYIWKVSYDWQTTAPSNRFKRFSARALRYFKSLIIIFAVGGAFIYAVYFIFTVNYPIEKQKSDTKFILASFADGPDPEWKTCLPNSGEKLSRRLRCLAEINVWMAGNKIMRPLGQYLLGILMVMQRSSGGNTGYFLNEVSAGGWWYYFPVVFLFKEPTPSLILICLALFLSVWQITKNLKLKNFNLKPFGNYIGTHFAEFSMLAFVIFYWIYSVKSPLNIGFRHLMPTMPFLYILCAGAVKKWFSNARYLAKSVVVAGLIAWYFMETLIASPYYLSYFNQFGGGVWNGYRSATDSNYDWGQDLKRLKKFVEENNIEKIGVDYFGGGSLRYYLNDKFEPWRSSRGNPKNYGVKWLAISINTLQGALGTPSAGFKRKPEDEYQWLENPYQPYARAGTSIFIYKF